MKISFLFLICVGSASTQVNKDLGSITVEQIDYDFILVHNGAFHGHLKEVNSYNGVCSNLTSKLGGCYGSLARVGAM